MTANDQNRISPMGIYRKQFKRLERTKPADYKPLKFPSNEQPLPELSRHIRWPGDYNSNHQTFDGKSSSFEKSFIVFPTLEPKLSMPAVTVEEEKPSENVRTTESSILPVNSVNTFPSLSNAEINEINGQANTTPLSPPSIYLNAVNNGIGVNGLNNNGVDKVENSVVNKTIIENGYEPLIYIDDDGNFQIKYLRKNGENATNNGNERNEVLATSINETNEATAIIFNDNQQNSMLNQRVHAAKETSNIVNSTMTYDLNEMHTIEAETSSSSSSPSSQIQMQPQRQPHQSISQIQTHSSSSNNNNNGPKLFNGLPIFVQ